MEFKHFDTYVARRIKTLVHKKNDDSSFFTTGILLLWNEFFNLSYFEHENTLLFKGINEKSEEVYFFPLGENPEKMLALLPDSYIMYYIPEEYLSAFSDFSIQEIENEFDYVYDYKDLLSLTGKNKATIRNHINSFVRNYPQYRYENIDYRNINDVHQILDQLQQDNIYKAIEIKINHKALKYYFGLDFIGYILYADEKPVAFTIGEIIKDTLYIQFEKNNHSVEGSGDMNRHLFLQQLKDRNIKYVNREEDAGDSGLRISKMRLGPCKFVRKYQAVKI